MDIGVARERFLLVDDDGYPDRLAAYDREPARDTALDQGTRMLLLFTSGTTGASKAAICSQGRLAELGYLDERGYLYFAGRSGDWIRVDDENISAPLIERILRRHPEIRAAGAFGVPDARSGDQVMTAIELAEDVEFDDLELAGFLAAQTDLGPKAIPRFVRTSHALPATGSNKVRKKRLQLQGWRTDEPVYWWQGRGEPHYTAMTEKDKSELFGRFTRTGASVSYRDESACSCGR